MPPRLSQPQIDRIEARIRVQDSPLAIAEAEGVAKSVVYRFKRSIETFNTPYRPSTARKGQPKRLTQGQEKALLDYLLGRPDQYLEEQQYWLWDHFDVNVSLATITRTLKGLGYTKEKLTKRADEQHPLLREAWRARLADWRPDQIVFVDESAANEHTKDRKTAWVPGGIKSGLFHSKERSERYSIIPAYSIDGIIAYHIHQGSCTADMFDWFVETYVLPLCTGYPGPRSVLILDTAPIHKTQVSKAYDCLVNRITEKQQQLRERCLDSGVILAFLPPCSPDFNPIEEHFREIKKWMKKNTESANLYHDYKDLLGAALNANGSSEHAIGHFKRAGIEIRDQRL